MAKYKLRQKAISFRLEGMSYNQIRTQVKVSKSSLSLWLKNYPLSEERLRALRDFSEIRIEKYRATMLAKREKRFAEAYNKEKIRQLPLSKEGAFYRWFVSLLGGGGQGPKTSLSSLQHKPSSYQIRIILV